MTAHLISRRWLTVTIVVAMAVALAACSGDSEPEAPETPEPTPAAAAQAEEPEPAAPDTDEPAAADEPAEVDEPAAADEPGAAAHADEPEPAAPETDDEPAPTDDADDPDDAGESAAAQAEPSGEAREISVDGGTTWQDLFDGFAPAEQSCIRDSLGDDLLASVLSEHILAEEDTEPWQAALIASLYEPTAEAVFFAITVAAAEEGGVTLNAGERSCLRAVVADLDVADLIAATSAAPEDVAASAAFVQGMIACLPDVMLRGMLEGSGMSYDDLSEEERDCLRELLIGPDWGALLSGEPPEDPEAFGALLEDLFNCVPGGLLIDGDFDDGETLGDDDHADAPVGATPATVGASVEGVLEDGGDTDMFVFEAQEGALYRIDAGLGTLDDSILRLLDADWWELAYNDDYADTLAARIEWEAPAAGDYYVAVEGWGPGSYTLTITAIANVDDHGDQLPPEADATSAVIGGSVEGELHHAADAAVFVFEAEDGSRYLSHGGVLCQVYTSLTLHDAGGSQLDYNDDHADTYASRIEWQAPESGDYYVAVGGFGGETGSYTLTITVFVEQ
ncbi:MAG: hypothetical protein F4Y94_04355 [Chloroflexi bacterium]|nr:hypothetical protein [Chloroflexota bacterium]